MGLYNISSGNVAIWLQEGKSPAFGAQDTMSTGDTQQIQNLSKPDHAFGNISQ
jgi:hypothetical protein